MEIAAREFDLSRYVSQLEEIGLGSARDVEQARIDCAEIVRSAWLDSIFICGPMRVARRWSG